MEERGKVVCMAKLAEQAERYDGMAERSLAWFVCACSLALLVCTVFVLGALHFGSIADKFLVEWRGEVGGSWFLCPLEPLPCDSLFDLLSFSSSSLQTM